MKSHFVQEDFVYVFNSDTIQFKLHELWSQQYKSTTSNKPKIKGSQRNWRKKTSDNKTLASVPHVYEISSLNNQP